jgi:hypothetical protein
MIGDSCGFSRINQTGSYKKIELEGSLLKVGRNTPPPPFYIVMAIEGRRRK